MIKHREDIFEKIFQTTQEGIMITDARQIILKVNPAFSIVTGYEMAEVVGKNPRILQSGRHNSEFYRKLYQSLETTGHWQGEIWNRRKNGEIYPEWLNISVIKDDDGTITNYVAIFSDITAVKVNERLLTHLAHHDPLTGLPNRLLFEDRLGLALAQASRNETLAAVIFIDLDRFKPINDQLGHRVGDILLQKVAERLRGSVRESDTVARMGGDEFLVLLSDLSEKNDITKIAQKIIDTLSQTFLIEGKRIQIGASLGVSLYPIDGQDQESLVRHADIAMYRAKKQGGNNFQIF